MRLRALACAACLLATGCAGFVLSTTAPTPDRIVDPRRADARIAALWVGHATVLLQMDDQMILTDPLLVDTVGQLTRRLQEPGIDPANLPPLDAVVVSHMHFDHLSYGSLDLVEPRVKRLFVPRGGLVYIPNYAFDVRELGTWESYETAAGLRVTAVPVKHVGFRYGLDAAWMKTTFTGYVFEYHGLTVYFGGDTAYDAARFRATAARFPRIDVAILPIGPIHPRGLMEATHVDPAEAVQAFVDLGARVMVPIHYGTLVNSFDAPGEVLATLERVVKERGLVDRVRILPIGGQAVLVPKPPLEFGGRTGGGAP
jgi:N-acyl-phosphatidylethanolamine-hydrolysing phospholipase D